VYPSNRVRTANPVSVMVRDMVMVSASLSSVAVESPVLIESPQVIELLLISYQYDCMRSCSNGAMCVRHVYAVCALLCA